MKIKTVDWVRIALSLVVFALVFAPTDVFAAANGNIFDTIQAKMLSTAKDVRKIVYVISGFGLVMFSVLAIFNKISFKHLGYIVMSLSLLAMMTPFINYFSGAGLDESDFSYGDFIIESNDASGYSNAGNQQSCEPNCPTESSSNEGMFGGDDPFNPGGAGAGGDAGSGGAGSGLPGEGSSHAGASVSGAGSGGAGVGGSGGAGGEYAGGDYPGGYDDAIDGGMLDEVVVTAEAPKMAGIDLPTTVTSELPTTLAGIPAEYTAPAPQENKKSFKDTVKDAINWGKGAVETVNNAMDTYDSVVAGVGAIATGVDQVGAVLNGDGNIIDKIGGVSAAVGAAVDGSGDWFSNAAQEGANVLDAFGSEGAGDVADAISDYIGDKQDGIFDWTNMGSDAADLGRGATHAAGRVGGIGKKN